MVNVILIVISVVVTFLTLIANMYFLVYFQHPDDKNTAWLPKVIVVLGLSFAYLSVMMLPMDVGNRSTDGNLDMDFLWMLVYMIMAFIVIVLVPFTIFYYESIDEKNQLVTGLTYTFVTLAVVMVWTGIFYATLGFADLPVFDMAAGLTADDDSDLCTAITTTGGSADCFGNDSKIVLQVSFVVYMIAMLAFFGWFLFVIFAPIGLVALPVSLIRSYVHRPKRMELDTYARKKIQIRDKSSSLLDQGRVLDKELRMAGKRSRQQTKQFNKFKADVVLLEEEMDLVRTAFRERGGNPIKYFAYLFVGILAASTSLLWFVHICIYMLPSEPHHPFLNDFFERADTAFGLIGTLAYGCFALYLIWCTVKGNISMGLRFAFFQVHPMKIGGTLMNSMVFNTGLIIVCSITVTQFCTIAFSEYARLTAVDSLFGAQAQHLRFIKHFFRHFPKVFVAVSCLSAVYYFFFPSDHPSKKFGMV